jgi:hypothetical protein
MFEAFCNEKHTNSYFKSEGKKVRPWRSLISSLNRTISLFLSFARKTQMNKESEI